MSSLNEFEILKRLGEGSFGTVYQVKRKSDGKVYAMKKVKLLSLSTKEKENALNEVRILASIKSQNVISYKDAFYDEATSCLCIIMDFASKGDVLMKINEMKKTKQYFDEHTIWRFAADMLLGLKALHDKKILHRDLKGANVFISEEGSLKLGDLNVSKVQKKDYALTQTGTPYYTSPEVWQNRPYDSKCDVWSYGCVLYEVATLEPPFKGISMEDLYKKVLRGNFTPINLQRYSSDLQKFLESCLKVDPKIRSSVDALLTHKNIMPFVDIDKLAASDRARALNKNISQSQQDLLQTIKLPFGNLKGLNNRLPKSNYEPEEAKSEQITRKKNEERPSSAVQQGSKPPTVSSSSQNVPTSSNQNAVVPPKRELSLNNLKNNNNINNNNVLNSPQYYSPSNKRNNSAQPQIKRVLSQNDLIINNNNNNNNNNYNNKNGGKFYMPPLPPNNRNFHYQLPKIAVTQEKDTSYNQIKRSNSRENDSKRGRRPSQDGIENYRNNSNSRQQQALNQYPNSPNLAHQKIQNLPPKSPSYQQPIGLPPKPRFN